jgi:ABC-2 type transport system ATP-binding protein
VLTLEGDVDAAAVAALPGVAAVQPAAPAERGGAPRLTAIVAPGAPVQDVLRAVLSQGFDVTRFEMKEPTLHDAFIVLTGQALPPPTPAALETAA